MKTHLEFDFERNIRESLNNLYSLYQDIDILQDTNQHYDNEQYENTKDAFKETAETIYLQISAFLEHNGFLQYLKEFEKVFKERIENKDIYGNWHHEDSGENISNLYSEFWKYLKPFNLNAITESDYRITQLERILKATSELVKLSGREIKNEPDITRAIKSILEIIFPSIMNTHGQSVLNRNGVYKPDIFIPEAHSMVEYKFINSGTDIRKCIGEISDDVKGYESKIGISHYKFCYSVFFVRGVVITEERFQELWKEKNHPPYWKPILVFEKA